MCGLAGIIGNSGNPKYFSIVNKMLDVQRHRGPDYSGIEILDNKAYLGFNRLSIIDLSDSGRQPLFNENRRLALLLNGEIYNYLSLRDRLCALGHKFSSKTDAETVLHAYEEWGQDCLRYLRGMFAFVLWDRDKEELFLARDRIGIKPLYYLHYNQMFIFASELKAFTVFPPDFPWKIDLDKNVLDIYLHFPFIMDNENTLMKGIKKIPPGYCGVFKKGQFNTRRYWKLEKNDSFNNDFIRTIDETENVLKEAVDCHFISDVPVALMLSGGLDSSLIAALALQCKKEIKFAITVGYPNCSYDESKFGKFVADHLNIKHIELEISPREISDKIEDFVWYFDDLSTTGFFNQILMAKKVHELGIKVVLVGQGADEVFGGYHIFKLSMLPFSLLPSKIWNMFYYRLLTGKKINWDYIKMNPLINKGAFWQYRDLHKKCSEFEILYQLPNYMLFVEDRGFMSSAVESRVPYLDHKVVEHVYNLPQSFKLKGSWFTRNHMVVKYILRKIASRYLPDEIVWRKKQGVPLRMPDIVKCNKDKVRENLLSDNSLALSLFTKSTIKSMLANEQNLPFISRLYVLEIWARQYLHSSNLNN